MKITRVGMAVAIATVVATGVAAQEPASKSSGRWLAGIEAGGGTASADGVVTLGASVVREVRPWLDLGVFGRGVSEVDHEYTDEIDRSYHSEIGYGGIRIRPNIQVGESVEIGAVLENGTGVMVFRYDREYQDGLTWTEEILDQVNYAVYSAGVDVRVALGPTWALSGAIGYQATSPVRTPLADSDVLTGAYGNISIGTRF